MEEQQKEKPVEDTEKYPFGKTTVKHCPTCDKDTEGGIWCGVCGKAYSSTDASRILGGMKFKSFTGASSTSPKVEKFWQTGDPSVFAKKGALDYQGD